MPRPAAAANTGVIASSGPLKNITISADLNCQVNYDGDTHGEFFEDKACGTFIAIGNTVYGPQEIPAGPKDGTTNGYKKFTKVSQTAVSGAGTVANPYKVVTVVDAGTTKVRLTQTDSYVVGQQSYRTDVQVSITSGLSSQNVILYRAGDCFVNNDDRGFGSVDAASGAVSCVGASNGPNGTHTPNSRTEQFMPLSSGSKYLQSLFSNVWNTIVARQPFPSTCQCSTYQDNGAGLSWSFSVSPLSAQTRSNLLTFSPIPLNPLITTKTADATQVSPGGTAGYTITIANPNPVGATVSAFADDLPVGFTYKPASTTGVTAAEPVVTGPANASSRQHVQWNGTFVIPANGSSSLHFNSIVSQNPGDYFNQAGGVAAGNATITPTGDTAKVKVLGPASLTMAGPGAGIAGPTNVPANHVPVNLSPGTLANAGLLNLNLLGSGLLNLNLLGSGLLNLNLLGSGLLNLNLLGSGILNLNLLGSGLLNLNLLGSGLLNLNLLGSPLGFDSLGNTGDLGGSELVKQGLGELLLTSMPIKNGDSWTTRLAGTNLAGRPLATLNFGDVLRSNISPDRIPSLSDIDLTVGPLGRISSFALYMGDTRLRSIQGVEWCSEFERMGYADCGAALGVPGSEDKGKSASLLSLEIAGVTLNDIDGLKEVALGQVTFTDREAAIPHLLLRSLSLYDSVFGSVLVKNAQAAVDCAKIDCTSATKTLYDAQVANALRSDATIGTLGSAVAGVTILEAIASMAMADRSSIPFELPPAELGVLGYGGANPIDVPYTVSFTGPTVLANPKVTVNLPSQFRMVYGSGLVKLDGAPFPNAPSPTVNGEVVTWDFSNLSFPAGKPVTITFNARPGLAFGSLNASAVVTSGDFELSAVPAQPVNVADASETGDNINTPTAIEAGKLYFGGINHPGDADYFSFTAPAGSRINVYLTQGNSDADLVLYHPAAARQHNPLRPAAAVDPIDATHDRPLNLGQQGEPLDPAALNDIKLAPLPIAGISGNRGLAGDSLEAVAWDAPAGANYVIQVSGYNGTVGTSAYAMHVAVTPPSFNPPVGAARTFDHDADATRVAPANPSSWLGTKSLLVVDQTRLRRAYGDTRAQIAIDAVRRLENANIGARALFLDNFASVNDAFAQLDARPSDPERSNDVVRAINSAVDSTLGAARNGLQHLVIVGTDEIIPMSRVPDLTAVANERSFAQELRGLAEAKGGNNALLGAAAAGMILSDDAYGSFAPVPFLGSFLYTPDVALGRLVETPEDMAAVVNQFMTPVTAGDAPGILRPSKSLVTGYDFMTSMAEEIRDTLNESVTPGQVQALTSQNWTKTDLASALFGGTVPDVISANAHYSPNALLPASNGGGLFTTDDFAGQPSIARRILFQMGCHSGFSISNFLDPTGDVDDWPEAMLGRGTAAFVGNTGFGIGLRETTAFSARLTANFAKLIDDMPLGTALAQAKRDYLSRGVPNVYDYKIMAESTYFGLPMFKLPGAGDGPLTSPPRPTTTDATTGLTAVDISTSQPVSSSLWERKHNTDGDYWQLAPGRELSIAPNRPIQPQVTFDVTQPNLQARGAYLTKLSAVSEQNFDPSLARVVIGERENEQELNYTDVIYPTAQQSLTKAGGRDYLNLILGHFEQTSTSGDVVGVETRLTKLDARVLFAPASANNTAPLFRSANVVQNGGTASFKLDVIDPSGAPIKDVSVLFTDGSSNDWTFRHLTKAADGTWVGGFPVTGTVIRYIGQAVTAGAVTGLTTNKGTFFNYVNRSTGQTHVEADIDGTNGANGWYADGTTVTLTGAANSTFAVSDNGGAPTTYSSGQPIIVSGTGVHTLHFLESPTGASGDVTVPIDTAGPSIGGAPTTAPNAAGWYRGPVTVHFTCADAESGVKTCEPDRTVSTDGTGQSVTGQAVDNVDNTSTTTVGGINIDSTPPAVGGAATTAPNSDGWYKGPVTVHFTCSDDRSGIASCPADQTISTEGTNQSVTGTATDVAGNTTSYTVSGINIDTTAPSLNGAPTTSPNANGWYNGPVTIAFTCGDGSGSGVASCVGNQTISTSGANQSISATVVDRAGNATTTTVGGINIDRNAPGVVAAADRPANSNGWYNAPVTVGFTCNDPLSGVASCSSPVTLSADGSNQSATGNGVDKAGNTGSATLTGINIDQVAPTITATPNDTTWRKGSVTVTFTCSDDRSGLATGACPTAVTVSASGITNVTRSVTDKAGNTKTITVPVRVDNGAPTSDFDQAGPILVLPGGSITGKAYDDWSGIASVSIKYSGGLTGNQTVNATVSCAEPKTTCSWSVKAPILVGFYTATATATDRAGNVQSTTTTRQINVLS